jgi:hypothetical protein
MSEYQYYEFQTLDRRLSEDEQDELRELSSRAEITPTSFVNVYNFGDFRGDEHKVLEKYFDAFLYVANWGTHRLMFRLPQELFDVEAARPYDAEEGLSLHVGKKHVLLELHVNLEDGGDWEEGEGRLDDLLPLLADLLAGDLRSLYLGWLAGLDSANREYDEDEVEPPVPPGLGKLSAPLKALADFLWIDEDLLEVAARASAAPPKGPSRQELAAWLAGLPGSEKDSLLLQFVEDTAPQLRWELLQRFRRARGKPEAASGEARRTVGQLRAAAEKAEEDRKRRKAEEKARARAEHLARLAGREAEAWTEVETLASAKRSAEYDQAVALLKDLREVADKAGRLAEAEQRIREVRERHRTKSSLIERLNNAGLRGASAPQGPSAVVPAKGKGRRK